MKRIIKDIFDKRTFTKIILVCVLTFFCYFAILALNKDKENLSSDVLYYVFLILSSYIGGGVADYFINQNPRHFKKQEIENKNQGDYNNDENSKMDK